jgi:glycerophosphoryl diester phosphodiesterase
MPHPFFEIPIPTILGHRGAAGSAPENTLESFEQALKLGAHIIETDLHATRDGVPVLIHDDRVDRVCDGRARVEELPLDALQQLDAAYHFTQDAGTSFPMRGRGIHVPSLSEAFEAFPAARFNVEIKAEQEGLIPRVLELISRHARESLTLLTAGDDTIMASLRAALTDRTPAPAVGACTGDVLAVVQSAVTGEAPPAGPMALQIPADFGGRPLVTESLIAHAHEHGIAIHVWTINEPQEMQRLLDLGVDGLVTDHPERMSLLLAGRR